MANPSSYVVMYKDIESGGETAMAFRSPAERDAYFSAHAAISDASIVQMRNTTVLRRSGTVKLHIVREKMKDIAYCNYILIHNPSTDNVKYYCRILTAPQYVNKNTVLVSYVVDAFYTYMFEATYRVGVVGREQLSAGDYFDASEGPFTRSIVELMTEESIPTSKAFEKIYDYLPPVIDPDKMIPYKYNNDSTEGRAGDMCYVIQLSPFNHLEYGSSYQDFLNYFDTYHGMPIFGTDTGFGGYLHGFNRAHGTCVLVGTDDEHIGWAAVNYRLSGALNWLTQRGLDNCVIAIYSVPLYMVALDADWYKTTPARWTKGKYLTDRDEIADDDLHMVRIDVPLYNTLNMKCNRTPLKYIRVTTPSGQIKEYDLDQFTTGDITKRFFIGGNMTSIPTLTIAPINYKVRNVGTYDPIPFSNVNYDERVEYSCYYEAAYATNGYYTFIANAYASYIGGRNAVEIDAQNRNHDINLVAGGLDFISAGVDLASEIAGTALSGKIQMERAFPKRRSEFLSYDGNARSVAQRGASAASPSGNMIRSLNAIFDREDNEAVRDYMYKYRDEMNTTTPVDSRGRSLYNNQMYSRMRGVATADYYKEGSTAGYTSYQFGMLSPHIYIVEYIDAIVEFADTYFTLYGYNSGRLKLPYICNYIQGETDVYKTPKFLPYDGREVTYCQAVVKVEGIPMDAAKAIEALFAGGVRFVKYEG